jgi:adenylate cyclase
MPGFLSELKRRNVVKVGIAYAATGWIVVEIASVLFPIFKAPEWVLQVFTTVLIIGFPAALILAWVFELTPDGVKRTDDVATAHPAAPTARRLDVIIIALLAVAVGLFVVDRLLPNRDTAAHPAASNDTAKSAETRLPDTASGGLRDSIAVLPFVNMSADPDQDYLADGLTEELLNRLATISTLKVPARTSSFYFKGKNPELREVGDALGVTTVLEGSIRKSGDRLRISAELIDVGSGYHLWSESYDREMTDIFAIQDEITIRIMNALSVHLDNVAAANVAPPADPEVYHLVLRGRYQWNQRSEEGLTKAEELFREATRRDPAYAPAYAGLADTYLSQYDYQMISWEDSTVKARAAASKALELDERLADAQVSLAHELMHEWEWQKAEDRFRRAIELNPNYVVAYHWYALCLTALGRVDEAVAAMQRAQALDPVSTRINADLGMAYLAAGRYADAIAQEARTLELSPQATVPLWIRGMALEQAGEFERAETDMKLVYDAWQGEPSIAGSLGHLYAVAGKTEDAHKLLDELIAQDGVQDVAFFVALVYAGLDDADAALSWLNRAIDQRSGSVRYLKVEPRLRGLRAEAGYRALMDRVGLPP